MIMIVHNYSVRSKVTLSFVPIQVSDSAVFGRALETKDNALSVPLSPRRFPWNPLHHHVSVLTPELCVISHWSPLETSTAKVEPTALSLSNSLLRKWLKYFGFWRWCLCPSFPHISENKGRYAHMWMTPDMYPDVLAIVLCFLFFSCC